MLDNVTASGALLLMNVATFASSSWSEPNRDIRLFMSLDSNVVMPDAKIALMYALLSAFSYNAYTRQPDLSWSDIVEMNWFNAVMSGHCFILS